MLQINGTIYAVDCTDFNQDVQPVYKYDITTADGVRHREVAAYYLTYDFTIGNLDAATFDAVRAALLLPPGTRTISLPDVRSGYVTFTGSVESLSRRLVVDKDDDTERTWDDMAVKMTALEPYDLIAGDADE